jgi:hypothetical protein
MLLIEFSGRRQLKPPTLLSRRRPAALGHHYSSTLCLYPLVLLTDYICLGEHPALQSMKEDQIQGQRLAARLRKDPVR